MPTAAPTATIRTTPSDFVVEELPAYEASGTGEHLFVTFRKTGLTTMDAVRAVAHALDVDVRGAGYAGLKDRHAVTTQTASLPWPAARPVDDALALQLSGIEVLAARRHGNKLKPGHLTGNRFTLVLRGLDEADRPQVEERLREVGRVGVPNAFGPQRFGRDGDNPSRALAWLSGTASGPRDRREQRFLFSSLQSLLFNRVLDRRVADGSWLQVLPGDVAKKHDSGGIFTVPLEGPELDDAVARAAAGALSATGPMFGAKMRWPLGAPLELEREILASALPDVSRLEAVRHLGEGTRRPLRMFVADLTLLPAPSGAGLAVSFVLPKGGYATTVLAQVCHVVDAASAGARPAREDAPTQGCSPEDAEDEPNDAS